MCCLVHFEQVCYKKYRGIQDYFTSLYAGEMGDPRDICEDLSPVEVDEREIVEF
jgi:hypothetical protein